MSKNVEMKVEKNILTIKIDLKKNFGDSKSGKTKIVATTGGSIPVPGNENIKLGLNVFKTASTPKDDDDE